jgi:4-hydroxybenzoate polyprenyltransferase
MMASDGSSTSRGGQATAGASLRLRWIDVARGMRLHQWAKNVLIFVPLVTAHRLDLIGHALMGFLLFGLCVSGVYLLNDVMDVASDRLHPTKRHRPIASGRMSRGLGIGAGLALLVVGLAGSGLLLPLRFLGLVGVYVVLNVGYTTWLKRKPILDVIILAGFYVLRLLLGGAAIEVAISAWLLAFGMFLFLSLALIKRYVDLLDMEATGQRHSSGRAYEVGDLALFRTLGPASGYMAVLVLALYVNSEAVRRLYGEPDWLWLLCPVLLYWVMRMWFIAHRGTMTSDPLIFAVRDKVSYVVVLLIGGVLLLATKL